MSTPTPIDARHLPVFDPGFHHVLGSMPGVAYVQAHGLNGITLYMSPRVEGPHRDILPSASSTPEHFWLTLVHADDREHLKGAEQTANATSSSYLEEYRLVTADDRVVWVRDEAVLVPASEQRPAHWIGLMVDITREKEAESRAAEVEQRFRTLIERLPIVTYIDAPDESLTNLYVSPQINDLLGRPSGTTGDEWAERVHPDDRDRARRETVEGVRSGGAVHAGVPDGPGRRS